MKEEKIIVGGQAVIEGVMMRAPHSYAVAVRRPDGNPQDRESSRGAALHMMSGTATRAAASSSAELATGARHEHS